MSRLARLAFVAFAVLLAPVAGRGQDARVATPPGALAPVTARHGMVVAQEARAAGVGVDILRKGGNAIDAAVAVGFALAVTYPRAGNLGGGGFMLIHLAKRNHSIAIDYRETAPAATTRDIFLDANGEADPAKSRDSGLAIGVPGTVAGLAMAHARYGSGRFNLAQLIAPAINFASKGIPVADDTADTLPRAQPRLASWPSSAKIFLKADGSALRAGDNIVQRDLATTLRAIAYNGPSAFYRGPVAEKIVASVQAAGGLMTLDDLASYRPVARMPVRNTYRDYDIVSMPPPSSGGVQLIEMLNVLEGFPLGELDTISGLHVMIEAMKRAYADRAEFLGDPEVVSNPSGLIAKRYAAAVRATIDPERARPSSEVRAGDPSPRQGDNTTHYSIIDSQGNAVANTTTLNFSYGLGLVADGTGVLLNNELDDFAAKPGTPNAFGLLGGEANAPGPGKRPLSSMAPTIVLKDGKPFLVTGSPGGSRIPTAVLQVIVNVIDHRKNVAEAVAAPRIHHQWLPDEVRAEREIANEVVHGLEQRGHRIMFPLAQTSANSIMVTKDGLTGAADPRSRGALAAGY
jgi:gamma-glutamyltranspeptidase / glutathione hydrolase